MTCQSRAMAAQLVAAISLSACDSNNCGIGHVDGGGNGALGDQPTLQGQIDGWSYGAGVTLQARLGQQGAVLMTALIDPAGNFSLPLPNGATVTSNASVAHYAPTQPAQGLCSGCLQTDPQDYLGAGLYLTTVIAGDQYLIQHGGGYPSSQSYTSVGYSYVDRDVHVRGKIDCNVKRGPVITSVTDIQYQSGWNSYLLNEMTSQNITTITSYAGPAPIDLKWIATNLGPVVSW